MITYKKITEVEFIELLPKPNTFFYKGIKDKYALSDYMVIDTTLHTRLSKTRIINYHFYDLLLNNLKSWGNYPKRNKSIIGTTSIMTAKSYTSHLSSKTNRGIYCVIPINPNQEICICPKYDILYSFSKNDLNLSNKSKSLLLSLNNEICSYCESIDMIDSEIRELDYSKLLELLNSIEKDDLDKKNRILNLFIKSGKLSEYFFSDLLNPIQNGFKLSKEPIDCISIGKGKEVFASGKFLLVSYDKYKEYNSSNFI